MRHFSSQLKKRIVLITGCVVIPLLLILPLLILGMDQYNITGLLNRKGSTIWFHLLAILLLIWTDLLLSRMQRQQRMNGKTLIPLNILILIALFIPYREGSSLFNTLHIFFAYSAFVFFTCFFAYLIHIRQKFLTIFIMIVILCLFLCFTAGKVTGLAEVLFASTTSILLALSAV